MISNCLKYTQFLCLVLCLLAPRGDAADFEVEVRVINGRTGEPLGNRDVRLWLIYEPPGPRGLRTEIMHARTSAEGQARFELPEPLPKELGVGLFDIPERLFSCAGQRPPLTTEEVLRKGVVEQNKCDKKGKLKGRFAAKPGKVVVFVAAYKWWQRIIPIK